MAPSRKRIRTPKPSGSRKKKANPPDTGLFFGGTRLLQAQEGDETQDHNYLYGSDADSDAKYADTTVARKRRATRTTTQRGKAPASKQTTESDYDTDEKRIIHLKQLGYKDDYVSNRLVEEGRQQLSAKTISTRWLRLKKIVERKEEERLDDELSDWHIGEASITFEGW